MYNIYIHPLAAIPGPKLWAMSRVPCEFANLSGGIIKKIDFLHEKYGEIVRTGPDTVCFNNPDAWSEIYTQKSGQMLFPKDPVRHTRELWINGAPEIFTAENIDHPRLRRMLNPAFTNKALREQEPLIQDNVSLLIRKLQQQVGDGTSTLDIDKWINWTTFDLIGDLAFGETFDCMKNGGYHPWVALIFSSVRTVSMLGSIKQWPYLDALWELMISGLWNRAMRRFQSLVIEKVDRRLSKNSSRGDFLQSILEHKDPAEKMTRDELYSNSALLVMAGTETTATAVSGVVYHLARHPHILIPLQQEIRDKFGAESDMTFKAVAEISSLMAILNESMRLYPSVPATNPRRIPPGGARVMGQWLPEKVCQIKNVSIFGSSLSSTRQMSVYTSGLRIVRPGTFETQILSILLAGKVTLYIWRIGEQFSNRLAWDLRVVLASSLHMPRCNLFWFACFGDLTSRWQTKRLSGQIRRSTGFG